MRIDAQNEFSDAQAVTVTAVSTNIIDLGQAQPKIMGGEDLYIEALVGTAFASGTSIQVKVWTDNTTTVTDGADIISGDVVLTAAAVAGASLLRVSLKGLPLQQYLGLQYVVVGTMTAGTVDAALVITPDTPSAVLS
jgi:hypothetical protein